eukprot:TRINITY_DN2526_c0_g1_i4.p1 TRINITY_DN2526_c0_g1~~TRINITY_DN2526_c0_g1_i4.p1  ORF type:complete len:170 (-),score=50.83 TRINITY_DN2526_c0_g1_i4:48-557(-)
MHQTLAINDFGRSTMIAEGGLWDKLFGPGMNGGFELMQAAYRVYNHSARSFPVELQLRGFGPVDQPGSASDPLPGYHYRDDGFKLWNAIRDYVSEVLSSPDIYGGTPQQSAWKIAADAQLAALWRELSDPARGECLHRFLTELCAWMLMAIYLSFCKPFFSLTTPEPKK